MTSKPAGAAAGRSSRRRGQHRSIYASTQRPEQTAQCFAVMWWFWRIVQVLLVASAWTAIQGREIGPRARLCYVADWAAKPARLDPSLCTMMIYAFGRLTGNGTVQPFPTDRTRLTMNDLAALGKHTRIGVSIGGWAEASERFTPMAGSAAGRKAFLNSVVDVVKRYGLSAVELAWISPTLPGRGGLLVDRVNYVTLVKEMKPVLAALNVSLGVAIPVADNQVDVAYDVEGLAKHVDWLLLQAYDLHGHWEPYAGVNAPITSIPGDKATITHWLNHILSKAPPDRVVLGMPAFGRTWTLVDSPVPGGKGSLADPRTVYSDAGMMAYFEICPDLNERRPRPWAMQWDDLSKTPYAVRLNSLQRGYVSYDDASSIRAKVRLALQYDLAGVGLFTINHDDGAGSCSEGRYRYPLLTAAKEEMDTV